MVNQQQEDDFIFFSYLGLVFYVLLGLAGSIVWKLFLGCGRICTIGIIICSTMILLIFVFPALIIYAKSNFSDK
jgi:hypothetical protein